MTNCGAATFTHLPHEICPPQPCKKNSICYENNDSFFFACKARDPNPPRKFFLGATFFSTGPLAYDEFCQYAMNL